MALPHTYLIQEHFHIEDIQDIFSDSNYTQQSNTEVDSYVDLSPHHRNHRHSSEEPEHTHAHGNTNSHSQNVHFISNSHVQYVWQINTKMIFNNFKLQNIKEPFPDAVFRPPIS